MTISDIPEPAGVHRFRYVAARDPEWHIMQDFEEAAVRLKLVADSWTVIESYEQLDALKSMLVRQIAEARNALQIATMALEGVDEVAADKAEP